jgi:hypothetical protein
VKAVANAASVVLARMGATANKFFIATALGTEGCFILSLRFP